MVASTPRLLLLAAAVAAAASTTGARAANLTAFPDEYDVLSVALEFEVELIATQAAAAKNDQIGGFFNAFADASDAAIAAGNATLAQRAADKAAFYAQADAVVPAFGNTTDAAVQEAWAKYEFAFLNDLHEAQWDALYYGITQAKPSEAVKALLDKLDAFMTENAKAGEQEKLQEQLDAFFVEADKATPDFKKTVVGMLKDKSGFAPEQKSAESPAGNGTTKAPEATPAPTKSAAATLGATLALATTTLAAALTAMLM